MKQFTLLSLSLLLLSAAACGGSDRQALPEITATERALASSSNDFGFDLFAQLAEEGQDNVFISPLSVSLALGMATNGARGETLQAMQDTLRFEEMGLEEINQAYANLLQVLTGLDPKVQIEIANSVWIREGFQVAHEFTSNLAAYFLASVTSLDFDDPAAVDIINAWVRQATHDKIDSILDHIPGYAVLYLINAVYFKGDWTQQFDRDATEERPFTLADGGQRTVPMMIMNAELPYAELEDLQAVELAYGDGFFSMTVLLPGLEQSIDDLVAELNGDRLASIQAAMQLVDLDLSLPSFELEYEKSLIQALDAMGMGPAFREGADFTGITSDSDVPLLISDVKHKTYVKVDEEGTEAAAVTSVEFGATSEMPNPTMRVDRPFILVIGERNTGALLFMGKIMDPAG